MPRSSPTSSKRSATSRRSCSRSATSRLQLDPTAGDPDLSELEDLGGALSDSDELSDLLGEAGDAFSDLSELEDLSDFSEFDDVLSDQP